MAKVSKLESQLNSQIKLLCSVLATNTKKISEQQQVDIRNELRRINSIIQLDIILSNTCYTFAESVPNVIEATKAARDAVLSWRVFDEAKAVECLKTLQGAVKLSGIVSAEERAMVVKAVGLKPGHWFKCPKGHFYCIGECGGAMEESRCPECGAKIGGRSHTLTAGNRHAPEMDGARFAAWSEEANNMANFNFDN
ncbi:NFX1-type zinc finger-containing protein 1-like [Choristoneura fumiferana]|uniref:NFX1-type zinc finger-containing protein 1-like n=1 Tax=Choristoneura fumiferana TaxID=7141 RepID=UPI003D154D06